MAKSNAAVKFIKKIYRPKKMSDKEMALSADRARQKLKGRGKQLADQIKKQMGG